MVRFHNPLSDLSLVHPELLKQLFEIPGRMAEHWLKAPLIAPPKRMQFGKHRRQYFLLWENPKAKRNRVLFFVHGGGWRNGFPGMYPDVAAFFLELGYHVVMTAYRLAPAHQHEHMMEDMELAIRAVQSWAQSKGWGQTPILVSGSSAGATLAAHLVYDRRRHAALGIDRGLLSGFLSFAGPLDIDHMPPFTAVEWYTGGKPGSKAFIEANPATHLQPDEQLPALLMHCPDDAIVPYACSVSFAARYPDQKKVELWTINGRTHLDSMRFAIGNTLMAEKIADWVSDK